MEHNAVIAQYLRYGAQAVRPERDDESALIAAARGGERAAADALLRHHLPFVIRAAMEFRGRGVPIEDLINEGCLGLLKAIKRFDATHGARFMTYASFWVRKAILDALADQPRVVRVPRYQREKQRPIPKEVGLDAPADARNGRTFGEGLADRRTPSPGSAMLARETVDRLHAHMGRLTARERVVLVSRFGLRGGPTMTLMEVGERLAISRERVRQIEFTALARLRSALRRDHASTGFRLAPTQM